MTFSSILAYTDAYKLGRILEYPKGTQIVNEALVPRDVKYFEPGLQELVEKHGVIVAGIDYAVKSVEDLIMDNSGHVSRLSSDFKSILGKDIPYEFLKSCKDLHEYVLQYDRLPLKYKYIEEGTLVPIGTPVCVIENTDDRFYWLPNFIETIFLSHCWLAMVNATKNFYLRYKFERYADLAADSNAYIDWQGHDFSMRGLTDLSPQVSIGQLMSFKGSDTLYGIHAIKDVYDVEPNELILGSVSAFEHSSVTTNIQTLMVEDPSLSINEAEKIALKRFINEVYPTGIVSYVADSYDFWGTVASLEDLKEDILNRNGKLVIRPDSDDPYKCICGRKVLKLETKGSTIEKALIEQERNYEWGAVNYLGRPSYDMVLDIDNMKAYTYEAVMNEDNYEHIDAFVVTECDYSLYQELGLIQSLDHIFGSTVNSKGYKVLNSKIGAIYGDGINFTRATQICERLIELGYSPENIVFGMGATWQSYATRDNIGLALKTTKAVVDGVEIPVVKDPKTNSGHKKASPKGEVYVTKDPTTNKIVWYDETNKDQLPDDYFDMFLDYHYDKVNFSDIRENVTNELRKLMEITNGK